MRFEFWGASGLAFRSRGMRGSHAVGERSCLQIDPNLGHGIKIFVMGAGSTLNSHDDLC